MLDTVEIKPGEPPVMSVIWMHGLGADGRDFLPILPELELEEPVKFVFPNAPIQAVGINGGVQMRAWYDIKANGESSLDDILESCDQVQELVDKELKAGLHMHQIVLAGFSQGGVIAQHLGLRQKEKLAGILAMSTYMPFIDESRVEFTEANADTPWMIMHGRADNMIPIGRARNAYTEMQALNYAPQWKEYEMAHSLCMEQVSDIAVWLKERLANLSQ